VRVELGPGSTLGRYRVVSILGTGGMGEVFRARDDELDRDVAVKVLPQGAVEDSSARARFEREARAIAALSHPNILTIHDFGTSGEHAYAVMELLDGESLRHCLRRGPLPWREALRIAHQVACGLAAAHDRSIVHRDIKPGNIHLTSTGQVKILDFGIARFQELQGESESSAARRTRTGAVMGTASYMSPEQARGERVDGRSDLFSLGRVPYEILTGRRPFRRKTLSATLLAITSQPPPPVRDADSQIPVAVEALVMACLDRHKERRIPSASDLQASIDAVLDGGRYTAPWKPKRRWPRWRKVALAVAAAVIAVALATVGRTLLQRAAAGPGDGTIRSVAVLPLVDMSPQGSDYFADGMTEAVIAELGRIRSLRVISRTSVMRFRGSELRPPEIAQELGVDAIIEGSVTRFGERVRVIVQLIEGSSDEYVWTRTFENELRDILTLQGEIASAVAREVRTAVTPTEQGLLHRARQVQPEAHEAYLRGRYEYNRVTVEGTRSAIEWFSEAVMRDPGYALGFAGLAEAQIRLAKFMVRPGGEDYDRARIAANRAIELDPSLGRAHASLGAILSDHDWDWPAADHELRRALELNPGDAGAHEIYAFLLTTKGRFEEAIDHARRAQELDPLAANRRTMNARILYFAGRFEECVRECRHVLEMDDSRGQALGFLGLCLEGQGRLDEAIEVTTRAVVLLGLDSGPSPEVGHMLAIAGREQDARSLLARMQEQAHSGYAPHFGLALLHIGLGDNETGVEELEYAYLDREPWMRLVAVDPRLRPLRNHPGFRSILRRMGLQHSD